MDIGLFQQPDGSFDIRIEDGDIVGDDTLYTALAMSLFTDRRANADDPLPYPNADRRGWWADAYADVQGDLMGSRLWLLNRAKLTQDTLNRAEEYCEEALQWLVEDKVATSVSAACTVLPANENWMQIVIAVTGLDAVDTDYQYLWKATINAV